MKGKVKRKRGNRRWGEGKESKEIYKRYRHTAKQHKVSLETRNDSFRVHKGKHDKKG